jgi:hypothetical protein
MEQDENGQGQRGNSAQVADGQSEQEDLSGAEEGIPQSVVVGGQLVLRDLHEVQILKEIEVLGILALVVFLPGIDTHEDWPGQRRQKGQNTDGSIEGL